MLKLPRLQPGDQVEIIAPASRCTAENLQEIQTLLTTWGLRTKINPHIFGDDLLCANSDNVRFNLLKDAVQNPENKAIVCARGGYGSMRLISELAKLLPPTSIKIFIGMSDITALNLFFQQKWQWPVIHGALAPDRFSKESIAAIKSILFSEQDSIEIFGVPLNEAAKKNHTIHSLITGGNLTLVQTSIGTVWELDSAHKILFLEEVNERGYRVDRMLEHLKQANILKNTSAILFGDFIKGSESDGVSLVQPVLERFAQECQIPVIQIKGFGHDTINFPLLLGTPVKLTLGEKVHLNLYR